MATKTKKSAAKTATAGPAESGLGVPAKLGVRVEDVSGSTKAGPTKTGSTKTGKAGQPTARQQPPNSFRTGPDEKGFFGNFRRAVRRGNADAG